VTFAKKPAASSLFAVDGDGDGNGERLRLRCRGNTPSL